MEQAIVPEKTLAQVLVLFRKGCRPRAQEGLAAQTVSDRRQPCRRHVATLRQCGKEFGFTHLGRRHLRRQRLESGFGAPECDRNHGCFGAKRANQLVVCRANWPDLEELAGKLVDAGIVGRKAERPEQAVDFISQGRVADQQVDMHEQGLGRASRVVLQGLAQVVHARAAVLNVTHAVSLRHDHTQAQIQGPGCALYSPFDDPVGLWLWNDREQLAVMMDFQQGWHAAQGDGLCTQAALKCVEQEGGMA